MFKQVIVGVDQHQGGRDAITLRKLLVASDGELTLAHVYLGDPTLTRPSGGTFGAGERKRGRELLTAVRDESGVDAKLLCTASSSVGRGLHEVVEAQGADLLVVGFCQRSFIGRVLVGDDTRDALNGAPCAIAVAPFGYSPTFGRHERDRRRLQRLARKRARTRRSETAGGRSKAHECRPSKWSCFLLIRSARLWAGRHRNLRLRWTKLGRASPHLGTSSPMLDTVEPPRSWRCTAPRSTCSLWAPAATARSAGSFTAAPPSGSRASRDVRCSCCPARHHN